MSSVNITNAIIENCSVEKLSLSNDIPIIPRNQWTWKYKLQSSFYMYPQLNKLLELLEDHFRYVCNQLVAKFPKFTLCQWEYFILDFSIELYGKFATVSKPICNTTGITTSSSPFVKLTPNVNPYTGNTTSISGVLNTRSIGNGTAVLVNGNTTLSDIGVINVSNSKRKELIHIPSVDTIVSNIKKKFYYKSPEELIKYVSEARGLVMAGTEYIKINLELTDNEATTFWPEIYNMIKNSNPIRSE